MRCPNCGKRMSKDGLWCDNCGYQKGTAMPGEGEQEKASREGLAPPSVVAPPKRDINWPRVILVSGIIAVIVIPIIIGVITFAVSMQSAMSDINSAMSDAHNAISSIEIQFPDSQQSAEAGVTEDNYDKIYPGMSYKEVVQLFGMEGAVLKSDRTSVTYIWKNGSTFYTIEFVDDYVIKKIKSS